MEKQLLVYIAEQEVRILVPKQRGDGFLKVPVGHHAGPIDSIASEIGFDIFGLDGSLDVQTGYTGRYDRKDLLARIMTPVCSHYGFPYKEISSDDFWGNHPVKIIGL